MSGAKFTWPESLKSANAKSLDHDHLPGLLEVPRLHAVKINAGRRRPAGLVIAAPEYNVGTGGILCLIHQGAH